MFRILIVVVALCPSFAWAEEPSAPAPAAEDENPLVPQKEWDLAMAQIPWSEPAGLSVGFGYINGSWGGYWTQGLQIHIPFALWGAVVVRGLVLQDGRNERYDAGGRLELRGQSPVFLNIIRIYGGGGVQVFKPIHGVLEANRELAWGGGGHFGFEFFYHQHVSFFIEIGGNGGGTAINGADQAYLGTGPTVMAGMQVYPF